MPTATKTTKASDELRQLEAKRDQLHAAVRDVRRQRDEYNAETERLRTEVTQDRHVHPEQYEGVQFKPVPGTAAADLQATVRERMAGNPHADDYEKARAAFVEADAAVQHFRRARFSDLLAELHPQADTAIATLRRAWETLVEGSEQYAAALGEVRAQTTVTPGLINAPDVLGFDNRVEEWARQALEVLAGEIIRPGLTPMGQWKVRNGG